MNLSPLRISSLLIGLSCVLGCGDSGDGAGGSSSTVASGTGNTVASGTGKTVASGTGTASGAGPGLSPACYNTMAFICRAGDADPLTSDQCTQGMGVPSTTCSSTGLLGCCTIQNSEQCYYQGGAVDALSGEANCKATTGKWTTGA